ncbi:MAG: hypothetical protein LBS05_08285 [Tannerellaceae bacterium]|jgi:hypothetical protein|nr:hypothetical protein [Tannerellaceae bacterium]
MKHIVLLATFVLFFGLSPVCLSQSGNASSLEGTWTLENLSVLKIAGADTTAITMSPEEREELFFLLSDTVAFRGDTVMLSSLTDCGCGNHVPYTREGNHILISSTAAPIGIDYRLEGETLYFRQQLLYGIVPFAYQVRTSYKKLP